MIGYYNISTPVTRKYRYPARRRWIGNDPTASASKRVPVRGEREMTEIVPAPGTPVPQRAPAAKMSGMSEEPEGCAANGARK